MREDEHLDKEELELYVLNRLPERRVEPIEDHLLVCPECQGACRAEDQMMRAVTHGAGTVDERRRHVPLRANSKMI